MKIAIQGCGHGELDEIYSHLTKLQSEQQITVDLLIICGDFQAIRNYVDQQSLSCPEKYKRLGSFHQYYAGIKRAPVLTIFIGGNHEASNYMMELYHGGWVCENIYFMGYAGVFNYGGLRIGGLSGIWKEHDYYKGHCENIPLNSADLKSAYHTRSFDVERLLLLQQSTCSPMDIFVSHDWPRGITQHGNCAELLREKPYFRDDIESNRLGSLPGEQLMRHLRPRYWFAAHMHVRFEANVLHLDGSTTKFLALDKCMPRRKFMEIIDIEPRRYGSVELRYDLEWLAILRTTNELMSRTRQQPRLDPNVLAGRLKAELNAAKERFRFDNDLLVPKNFQPTAPMQTYRNMRFIPLLERLAATQLNNPQTEQFCKWLGLRNCLSSASASETIQNKNPDEIPMEDVMSFCDGGAAVKAPHDRNPDEIPIELLDDDFI